MEKVKQGDFSSPSALVALTPPALEAICLRAMSLKPADRYQTALDVAADVDRWLADEPTSAYAEPWAVRMWRWTRHHRTSLAAAGVLLISTAVAAIAIAIVAWRGERATAAEKEIAEQNFELAKEEIFSGFALIESLEATLASSQSLQDARKTFLVNASEAFRQYVKQDPNE